MAGVAGLEPVTSAVTGQRSNQLSYTPAMGERDDKKFLPARQVLLRDVLRKFFSKGLSEKRIQLFILNFQQVSRRTMSMRMVWLRWNFLTGPKKIRAADAKEVGVGNPAEETCCYPNKIRLQPCVRLSRFHCKHQCFCGKSPYRPQLTGFAGIANPPIIFWERSRRW